MLYKTSYHDHETIRRINNEVGKALSLHQRWLLKGSGSPKLTITAACKSIKNILDVDQNRNTCNIEIREKGIILRFRSRLDTYALPIAYWKLTLYKGRAQEYSIYKDSNFIKVRADRQPIHRFFTKILEQKNKQITTSIDQL